MAGREREVKVTVLGDTKHGQKALSDLGDQADKTDGHFSKLGDRIGSFGKAAALGLVGIGVAAGGFLAKAVMSASDLEETLSKVAVVFGETKDQVVADADFMAKKFGIPKQAFLDASASIGLIGKASGLAKADVGQFSTGLARLAVDASSFYNVPLEEALGAIQSGLTGEAEPLKKYGVLLNEAAVSAEAAALGLGGMGRELTEGEKVQARASLITKGLADANGDLERTQGSLSNRIRELKGRFENFAATVGTAVIPIVLKLMDAGERLGPAIGRAFDVLKSAFSGGGDVYESPGFFGFLERMGSAVRQIVDDVKEDWPKIKATIMAVVSAVVAFVKDNWPKIKATISETMKTIQALVAGVLDVIATIWSAFGKQITSALKVAFQAIVEVVRGAMEIVRGIIQVVTSAIHGDWSGVWDGIKAIVDGVWDAIVGIVRGALGLLKEAISIGLDLITGIFGSAWDAIFQIAREGVALIVDVFLAMVGHIIHAAATAFGWIPGLGGKLRDAAADFDEFRASVNESLRGIQDRTVNVNFRVNQSELAAIQEGAGVARQPVYAFAKGMEVGPVPGSAGQAVPIVAHAGEWIVTPEQMAKLQNPGTAGSALGTATGGGVVYVFAPQIGTLVGTDGMYELTEMIQAELLRKQRRVPSLGLSG